MRIAVVLCIVTMIFLSACVQEEARFKAPREPVDFVLVHDGEPRASIVIGENPTRAAEFAAAELRYHVKKITGAVLPIAVGAKTDGPCILVGESAGTRKLGLRSSDFADQEYQYSRQQIPGSHRFQVYKKARYRIFHRSPRGISRLFRHPVHLVSAVFSM